MSSKKPRKNGALLSLPIKLYKESNVNILIDKYFIF